MLTFKDASGKDILTIKDDGEIFIEDKELEEEMKEQANKLKDKEEE